MTYEEIAAKYDGQVKERRSKLALAKAKLDFYRELRNSYIETRELYRNNGTISAERTANWNRLTAQIRRIDGKIADAEINYGKVSIGGEDGINRLMKKLGL